MGQDKKKTVVVSNEATVSIVLHAVKHAHHAVHGVLLGSFEGAKVHVEEAVPVCHGSGPTQPLVESALSLIESINKKAIVVGWYVSPRLHKDDRPGPAALKIVSGLAGDNSSDEPVLLVLCNENLDNVLQGEQSALENSMKALGKDFGKQWLDPLGIDVAGGAGAVKEFFQKGKTTIDLVDHFEGDPKSTWYTPPSK